MKIKIIFQLIIASLLVVSCQGKESGKVVAAEPAALVETAAATEPTVYPMAELAGTLGSLTFSGVLPGQSITLTGGLGAYEDGSIGQPYVNLVDHLIAVGDVNGDGTEDAAVFLVDNSTGSADFVYLVVVLNAQSNPQPLEAVMIGDRTPVKSLAVEGGQVIAEFIGPGSDDVACCPTRNIRQVFQVEDGRLVLRSSEDLGQVSLADLQGTDWHLLELNLDKEPLPAGSSITLSFDDSQISGPTGCSSYNGRIKAGEDGLPQSLMISSISAAQSSCTGSASPQETTYLDRLVEVIAWRYDFGHLSLTYKLGEEKLGELTFSPHEP